MKRWFFRIVLLLILGVVTTVGVAWGLAFLPMGSTQQLVMNEDGIFGGSFTRGTGRYTAHGLRSALADWDEHTWSPAFPTWCQFSESGAPLFRGSESVYSDDARGWPVLALASSTFWVNGGMGGPTVQVRHTWGLRHSFGPKSPAHIRVLPLRPIFPGFLINTLFYAAIWFGIFFGFPTLRRARRKRRGRCVICGYDLRGAPGGFDAGCSECGWGRG